MKGLVFDLGFMEETLFENCSEFPTVMWNTNSDLTNIKFLQYVLKIKK